MTVARYATVVVLRSGTGIDVGELTAREAADLSIEVTRKPDTAGIVTPFVYVHASTGLQVIRRDEVAAVSTDRCDPTIHTTHGAGGHSWLCACGATDDTRHSTSLLADVHGRRVHTCPDEETGSG